MTKRNKWIKRIRINRARWEIGRYIFPDGTPAVRCTFCGACLTKDEFQKFVWNYCPVCGAVIIPN